MLVLLGGAIQSPRTARGADPPVTFRADRLDGDLTGGTVTLQGGVEVAYDRYRLRSDQLQIRLDRGAVVFTGEVRAALCPCPDPPLTFLASGGRFEPPGDVVLRYPRLAAFGVPIFSLPWLWLRAPDRIGMLPPIVALRGDDGLLLGSGVHLPWGTAEGIDLRAGGYVKGGAEVGARLVAGGHEASVTADFIRGTRVEVAGRGARVGEAGVAWAADVVRGDRGRSGTVDLAAAARPFDTAAAELSTRGQVGPASVLIAGGAIGRAGRGEGPLAGGPRSTLAVGGPIGRIGSFHAEAGGVALGSEQGVLPIGRVSAGAEIDARPGPFELRASVSGRARTGTDGGSSDQSIEAAAAARADLEMPLSRAYPAALPGDAPWVHVITPSIMARGAVAEQHGAFFVPIGGSIPPGAWLLATGISTALGRYAGPSARLDLRAGATGGSEAARGLLHARLGLDARVAAAAVEGAMVGEEAGPAGPEGARSAALLGRLRIGALAGPWLRVEAAGQEGPAAGRARAVAAGAWAALPGDDLAYLAASGWTGGAEISIPWTRAVRTGARADVDLGRRALLAVRGLAEIRHPCGCLGLGLMAAHRAGRDGVDVALSIDVSPTPARTTAPAPSQPGK